jgi:Tfp pilus assembly protein PilN
MIPVHLNLLSPDKRRNVERLIYVQFLRNTIEIFVFVLSVLGILLLGGNRVLQDHLNELSANLVRISNQQARKGAEIKIINTILARTDSLQKHYTLWSDILPPLINAIPQRIAVSSLAIDPQGKTMRLTGIADTRSDLLLLQKNLLAVPLVHSADIPLSQLASKEHISFSVSVTLK